MPFGAARAVLVSRRAAAAAGITIGTTGLATHNSTNQTSCTFASGITVDGGGAKLLLIAVWTVASGSETKDHNVAPDTFTLNGVTYDALITSYMQNAETSKWVQAAVAIWNTPSAGSVVIDPGPTSPYTMTGTGCFYMNLSGLHATQPGTLVRDQYTSASTALAYDITTAHASSLLVAVLGARNISGPFTFDGASMTVIGRSQGAGSSDGDFAVAYRNGLAAGTYAAGGDSNSADASRFAGIAVELRAA